MRTIKLLTALFTISLFFTACDQTQTEEPRNLTAQPDIKTDALTESDNDYWARENLDLQAVGNVLKKADSAEDFEYLINSDDGINNLDLNGDGYADYISVAEYDDRPDNRRGLSLFSRFNGNDIQEIATIIFDRDRRDRRGARVYLQGNEQIYGDSNNFYEGNWLDTGLTIANWIFSDRDDYYRSPYYYDNYPDNYQTYQVVETPVYRERVTGYIVDPTFERISNPAININLESPYQGRTYDRVYARLANPTEQQRVFIKNNPKPPKFKELKEIKKADKNLEKAIDKAEKRERKEEKREDKAERKAEKREIKEDRKAEKREVKAERKERKPEKADRGGKDNNKQKANKGNGKNKGGKKKGKN